MPREIYILDDGNLLGNLVTEQSRGKVRRLGYIRKTKPGHKIQIAWLKAHIDQLEDISEFIIK